MHRRRKSRGFVLGELVVVMSTMCALLPIVVLVMGILVRFPLSSLDVQDEIGISQLRRVMNVCYDKTIHGTTLSCNYESKIVELYTNGNNLFIAPGTWIFLNEVDEVFFDVRSGVLFMTYIRNGKIREVTLSAF